MIGLMVLHWGTVDLTIKVGREPACGAIKPLAKSGSIAPRKGCSNTKGVSGSGGR